MDLDEDLMTPQVKKEFLEKFHQKHMELSRRQREYKKVVLTQLKSRADTIIEKSFHLANEGLKEECSDLRAQIWVANGTTHVSANDRFLKDIQCHVKCQEHLAHDIQKLKTDIPNMERETGRLDRLVYDMNLKTLSDAQHQAFVAHSRKLLGILENQLEVGIHRECAYAAKNASLREELQMMLNHRAFFNEDYGKLVQKLTRDKKYMVDLIEYVLNTFDNCIDVHEKINYLAKKTRKEWDSRKIELQTIRRKIAANEEHNDFMIIKAKIRPLADLQPKEYRRRDRFRHMHNRKINLYASILNKILGYTESRNVDEVIDKFQQHESLYYSYFSYANEMSFHMTLLNNSVNRLYSDVDRLKVSNLEKHDNQVETIDRLEEIIREKQKHNANLNKQRIAKDAHLQSLLNGILSIFVTCNIDASPLMSFLGDYSKINLVNMKRFLKLLESHLAKLVASVFVLERMDENKTDFIVTDIEKIVEFATKLDDIVLTQQCPECAEGEAFNMDERGDGPVVVNTVAEAKKNLHEKVQQPEMQYRLHSLSQCRLPRSRVLAAKRHI